MRDRVRDEIQRYRDERYDVMREDREDREREREP